MPVFDQTTVEPLILNTPEKQKIITQLIRGDLVRVHQNKKNTDHEQTFTNPFTHMTPKMGNYYSLLLFPELTHTELLKRAKAWWQLFKQYPIVKVTPKHPDINPAVTDIYKPSSFSSINYELNNINPYPTYIQPELLKTINQQILSLLNYGCQILINQNELKKALANHEPLPLRSACLLIEPIKSQTIDGLTYQTTEINQQQRQTIEQNTIPLEQYQQIIKNLPGIENNLISDNIFTDEWIIAASSTGENNYIRKFYLNYQYTNFLSKNNQLDQAHNEKVILQSLWYTSLFSGYKTVNDFYYTDLTQARIDTNLCKSFTQEINYQNVKYTHSEPDFSQPLVHQQYPQNFQTLLMSTANKNPHSQAIQYPHLLRVDNAFYSFNSKAQLKQLQIPTKRKEKRKEPSNVLPQLQFP